MMCTSLMFRLFPLSDSLMVYRYPFLLFGHPHSLLFHLWAGSALCTKRYNHAIFITSHCKSALMQSASMHWVLGKVYQPTFLLVHALLVITYKSWCLGFCVLKLSSLFQTHPPCSCLSNCIGDESTAIGVTMGLPKNAWLLSPRVLCLRKHDYQIHKTRARYEWEWPVWVWIHGVQESGLFMGSSIVSGDQCHTHFVVMMLISRQLLPYSRMTMLLQNSCLALI